MWQWAASNLARVTQNNLEAEYMQEHWSVSSSHFFFNSWGTELLQADPTLIRNRGKKPSLRRVIPFLLCVFSDENKAASVYREPAVPEGCGAVRAVDMTAPPLLHLWTVS